MAKILLDMKTIEAGFLQFCPKFLDVDANLQFIEKKLKNIKIDLIVLPELFNSGYYFENIKEVENVVEKIPDGKTTKFLEEIAKRKNIFIIAGLAEKKQEKFFNSAVFVGPDGYIGEYRKTHLFYEEKFYFEEGNTGFNVFETDIGKIGIMICYDWRFPESSRILALKGADVICHPSNLVTKVWEAPMMVRSLENKVFTITANRTGKEKNKRGVLEFTGKSQIISEQGKVLKKVSKDFEGIAKIKILPSLARNKMFNKYNDIFKDRFPNKYKIIVK